MRALEEGRERYILYMCEFFKGQIKIFAEKNLTRRWVKMYHVDSKVEFEVQIEDSTGTGKYIWLGSIFWRGCGS